MSVDPFKYNCNRCDIKKTEPLDTRRSNLKTNSKKDSFNAQQAESSDSLLSSDAYTKVLQFINETIKNKQKALQQKRSSLNNISQTADKVFSSFGAGSRKIEKEIEDNKKQLQSLKDSPENLPVIYKKITGRTLSSDEIKKIINTQIDANSPENINKKPKDAISFCGSYADSKKETPSPHPLRKLTEAELTFVQEFGPDKENIDIIKNILQRTQETLDEDDLDADEMKEGLGENFFKNVKKRNLTGQQYAQLDADSLLSLGVLDDEMWNRVNPRGLIEKSSKIKNFDIEFFARLEDEKWEKVQEMLSINDREPQFSGYDIENILNLDEKEYKKAKKMFFIPERKNNQIDSRYIKDIAKLNDENFKKASELFYIEGRQEQFGGYDIKNLINCDSDKLKLLAYIPGRKEQFKAFEIYPRDFQDKDALTSLDINKLKKLVFVEGRPADKQFESYDIKRLAKIDDEKLDKLLYIPQRKDDQFFCGAIESLSELNDEQWEKAQEFLFIENRHRQFNYGEIKELIEANDKEKENIEKRGLFTVKNGGIELNAMDILSLSNWNDELWEILLKRGILQEKNYRSAHDLYTLCRLDENKWQTLKEYNLFNIEGREKPLSAHDIESFLSKHYSNFTNKIELGPKEWEAISDRGLFTNKFGRDNYLSGRDVKDFSFIDDEKWAIIQKRGLLHLKERGDWKQFNADDLFALSNLNDEQWQNVEKRNLLYKKDRSSFYSGQDIKEFAQMDDEQWQIAEKRNLFYLEGRKDKQFSSAEINLLSNLNDEQWQNVEKRNLLYKKDRSSLYSGQNIKEFAQMDDKEWEKAKKRNLLLMKEGVYSRFSASDVKLLSTLTDEQWEKAQERNLIYQSDLNYFQLCAQDIIDFTLADDKTWSLVENLHDSGLSFNDIRQFLKIQNNLHEINSLNFKEKVALYSKLQNHNKNLKNIGIDIEFYLDALNKSLKQSITPIPITQKQEKKFFTEVMANNNPKIENTIRTADFRGFKKEGFPLAYPRKDFICDLGEITKDLDIDEKRKIYNLLAINPLYATNGELEGYDGILDISQLDKNNPTQANIYKLVYKFIYENKAASNNNEMNNFIDGLLAGIPEFINIIGKQQHSTHESSLDIHILRVLQECLKNPEYQKLNNEDKTVLKISVLLHDIAKKENTIDKGHQIASALYARNIMDKFFSEHLKDRAFEMIKNHHWLEEFNTGKISFDEMAVRFRKYDDFTIAKIIAQGDLKGIDENFYNTYAYAIDKAKPVESSIDKIYGSGNLIFATPNIKDQMLPTIQEDERTYKVLNLTEIDEGKDLGEYGFIPGTKKQDLRFLVHMLPSENLAQAAKTVDALSDVANGGVLSTSLLSMDAQRTYGYRKYGFILDVSQDNIANACPSNQASGYEKGINRFIELSVDDNFYRTYLSRIICDELDLTSNEYAQIYKQLLSKKYCAQIKDSAEFKAGEKYISGKELKQAIIKAQDALLDKTENSHNEIVAYNPKIKAVICKINSFNAVPKEMKDFAYSHNIPIFLTGDK